MPQVKGWGGSIAAGPWAGDPTVSEAAALGQGRLRSHFLCSLGNGQLAGASLSCGLPSCSPIHSCCPWQGWPGGPGVPCGAGCSTVHGVGRAPVLAVPLISAPASAGFGDLRGWLRALRCAAPPGPGLHSHAGTPSLGGSHMLCRTLQHGRVSPVEPHVLPAPLPQGSPPADDTQRAPLTVQGPAGPWRGLGGASTGAGWRACGHVWGCPSQARRRVGSGMADPAPGRRLGRGSASGWGGSPGGSPRAALCHGSHGRHLPAPAAAPVPMEHAAAVG